MRVSAGWLQGSRETLGLWGRKKCKDMEKKRCERHKGHKMKRRRCSRKNKRLMWATEFSTQSLCTWICLTLVFCYWTVKVGYLYYGEANVLKVKAYQLLWSWMCGAAEGFLFKVKVIMQCNYTVCNSELHLLYSLYTLLIFFVCILKAQIGTGIANQLRL